MNGVLVDGETVYPSKVVCIGRNYVAHIQELGNETPDHPVIFVKPNSAIARELCTSADDEVHYEAEITFALQSGQLLAVGVGLDLTKRALQSSLKAKGLPWERAKAFDKSAVFSQFVPFKGDVSELRMELYINEQLIQLATYDLMIYKPADIVAEVSSFMTLNDSDLLMTGTPQGVGKLNVGDQFVGKIFQQKTLLVEHSWQVT